MVVIGCGVGVLGWGVYMCVRGVGPGVGVGGCVYMCKGVWGRGWGTEF